MATTVNQTINCTQFDTKLSFIFKDQPSMAWQMVELQSNIYTKPNADVQQINTLSSMYCKIVEKLNILQDPRQKYFNNKMQKLMAEPFIIRCYSDHVQKKELNSNLNQKRKQLEQKLSIQSEKQNSQAFQHIINTQNQKQKKLKQKIDEVLGQHQKNLQSRLQLRSMKKQISSPKKKNSQDTLLNSCEFGNPQSKSPSSLQIQSEITLLDLTSKKNKKQESDYSTRTRSQRIMTYQFNNDSSQNDSQDEYRIQKLLKQQSQIMGKKKKIQFQDKSYPEDKR